VTVYAKRMNWKQRRCAAEFERLTGFEFMCQESIDSGEMSFQDAWEKNVSWLEGICAEVQNIDTEGACKIDLS